MKIQKIEKIHNTERELLTFKITKGQTFNLKDYMVVVIPFDKSDDNYDLTFGSFRFPSCIVKDNDAVKIFFEKGENSVDQNSVGGNIYNFYWSLGKKVLSLHKSRISLVQLSMVDSIIIK